MRRGRRLGEGAGAHAITFRPTCFGARWPLLSTRRVAFGSASQNESVFFMTFPNRERCSSAAEFHSSRTREVDESSVKNRLIQRQPVGLVPLGSSTPGRERARQRISTMRTRIVFSPPAALTVGFRLTLVAAAQQHCAGALTSRIPWRHQSGNTPYARDQAIAESAPAGHL